jgi:hypothetical protein
VGVGRDEVVTIDIPSSDEVSHHKIPVHKPIRSTLWGQRHFSDNPVIRPMTAEFDANAQSQYNVSLAFSDSY